MERGAGAPCQAWQSLEGSREVLPRSSGAQHPLSRSLGLYCPEKAQGSGNGAPGRQRQGCRKRSDQCRLRPGQGEGARQGASFINAQASEWAAARTPMVGVPKEPPTCLPTSVQPGEREEGPAAPPLPWGLEASTGLGWAPPWGVRGVGAGEAAQAEVWRAQKTAASSRAQCPLARAPPPPFPHPATLTPGFLSWGRAYREAGRVGGWPQGLRRPLPPLEGPAGSAEACSVRWE